MKLKFTIPSLSLLAATIMVAPFTGIASPTTERANVIIINQVVLCNDDGTSPARYHIQKKLVDQVYTRADLEFIFHPPTYWNNGKARRGEINLDTIKSDKQNQSIDCDAVTDAFSKKLSAMLEEGKPVEISRLKPRLQKQNRCKIKTLTATHNPKTAREIYQQRRDGVVLIGKIYKCDKCDKWHTSMASGFIISKDGIIVTNYHVLDNDKTGQAIAVQLRDGRMFAITEILASSKKEDLAVIKINADNLSPLPIAKDIQIGDPLYCISHPVKQFYTMTEGILAGDFIHKNKRREFAVTCDYAKGSSGAPIVDETGAVVAIVRVTQPVYYEQNHGVPTKIQMVWKYCIPSSTLLDLLK